MQKFNYIIKWYSREMFKHPLFELLLIGIFVSEYFSLSFFKKSPIIFIDLMQLLIIPLYLFLISSVFFKNSRVLVFELSILKSWRYVSIGRIITILIGLLPFTIGTEIFLIILNKQNLLIPLIISELVYSAIMMLISLSGKPSVNYVSSMIILFLLPIGVLSLIQSYAQLGSKIYGLYGYIGYILSPLYIHYYYKEGIVQINPNNGFIYASILILILLIIYILLFEKLELVVSNS